MYNRDERIPLGKLTFVQYVILAIFLVLGFRLARLQVGDSERYTSLAERNRVRTIPILAPRGKILDREGRIIVDNYPSFSALLLREQPRDVNNDIDKISAGLHIPVSEIRERLRKFAYAPAYQPMVLKDDITPGELAFIEAHRNELPELETIMVHRRLYPRNGFMAHIIGYVGEVSEEMLNQPAYELYEPGDVVGRSGVEQAYNDILMGKDGSRRALVNSRGKEVGRLSETPAIPGRQLKLTIDLDLQIAAEEALDATGKNGGIIAMDPHTGEVLAMVSRPTFDPNDFAVRITKEDWNKLITDEGKPLLNKTIQAQLAPGSVFKIIMATAGMQEGIAQTMTVDCHGGATFYGRYFKCWVSAEHRTHGIVNITKAIYQSCDVFFYTLAEKLGIDRIAKYATMLGLGKKTGIDLPQEVSGVMPSEEWKIRNFKQKWYAGETISVGIGQGAVAVTPVQLARALGGIAMGGELHRPHVADPTDLPPGFKQIGSDQPSEVKFDFDPQNWQIITDAMAEVVQPEGTAPSARIKDVDFAGKTGSAQTMSNALAQKLGHKHSVHDNGWFVGFTPRRNPNIIVCVLLEEGEHGYLAARTAAAVVRAYVDKQKKRGLKMATADHPTEVSGFWNQPNDEGEDGLKAGRFAIYPGGRFRPATAAPGLEEISLPSRRRPRGHPARATDKVIERTALPVPAVLLPGAR